MRFFNYHMSLSRSDLEISDPVPNEIICVGKPIQVFRNGILQSENVDYTFTPPHIVQWIHLPVIGDRVSIFAYTAED